VTDPIVRRIAGALGAPDLLDGLAALPGSDLTSLLLAVMRARATRATPADLLARWDRGGLVAPSTVDARTFAALDRAAFDAARDFDAIELG